MTVKPTIWDSVGNTPLIKINSLSKLTGNEIFAKLEYTNPGGSIKDRTAKGIILAAEESQSLKPGGVIVEGTAGNTGIGLATLAKERGYHVIISMPNNQSQEKYEMLKLLGAEVRAVPPVPFANENHFYHQAKKIAESTPNSIWGDQFENLGNFRIHLTTTGPEIWEQMNHKIDAAVFAVGTGGTMAGVSQYLKQKKSEIFILAADPYGSGIFNWISKNEMSTEGSSITEGIGIMRITANFKQAKIDKALRVNDQEVLNMIYHIGHHDGLMIGTSSGVNLFAAYRHALENKNKGLRIVTMICDHGSRYASKILNDNWLKEKNLLPQTLSSSL